MSTKDAEPFGPSPYDTLAGLAGQVESAIGMDWTNNCPQYAAESAAEAAEAWEYAVAEAHRVVDAAEALLRAATEKQRHAQEHADAAESEARHDG